tara:strand:+ start:3020 stop:3178 length:159 start_codon:yes stop_codon:yes gene_type:complete
MTKLRDLIVAKMTDEQKAAVKPSPSEATSMSDAEIAALPSELAGIKKATKTG